ncbi:hypothetical protein SAMN05421867_101475 [Cellulomonas marina]|uniref:Uncharacterized protein n=1 Tax=Cellulomonas marina TaxID=988821 RepID=A0A1I0VNR7_9CELL|nr:hypothetical protein SAMN05421867_101475 [Cellulomonas marina]
MTTTDDGPLGVLRPDGDRTDVRFERTHATDPGDCGRR